MKSDPSFIPTTTSRLKRLATRRPPRCKSSDAPEPMTADIMRQTEPALDQTLERFLYCHVGSSLKESCVGFSTIPAIRALRSEIV